LFQTLERDSGLGLLFPFRYGLDDLCFRSIGRLSLEWSLSLMKNKTQYRKNPVKRNMDKYHKPDTHTDKKKESKKTGEYLDDTRQYETLPERS
jgi:hypothetical protein